MNIKKIVYILILFSFNFGFSQNKIIDSLQLVLKTAKADTNKVLLLKRLAFKIIYSGDLEKGKELADEALVLSQNLNYEKGIALSDQVYGLIQSEGEDYTAAINNFNKALPIFYKLNAKAELASIYGHLGNVFYNQGLLTKALESFLKALRIFEEIGDKDAVAGYSGNIGLIYEGIKDNDKALFFYNKALKMNEEINSRQGMAINYGSIGVVYLNLKKEKIALDFFKKAFEINLEINEPYYLFATFHNFSETYYSLGDKKIAFLYANKMLELCSKGDNIVMLIKANQQLAKLYLNSGKLLLAEKLLLKSQSLLLNINSIKLKKGNIADLSDLYYKMGNYKKAMDYHLAFIVLKDSMLNDESYRKIMGQQAEFEYEKKAAADSVKVSEEKKMTNLQFKQEKTQRFALYGGLILVLIFAGFMFNRFKITQKQKNIIELKEEETKKQNIIITQQKHLVEEKHKEITDSTQKSQQKM